MPFSGSQLGYVVTQLIRFLLTAGLALPVLALWLAVTADFAEANGRTVSILETTQGPYRIDVRVSPPSPRVGSLHMSIVLLTADGGEPVTDATVSVKAVGPLPESLVTLGPLAAYTEPPTYNWYDLNIQLLQEGEWGFTVDIARGEEQTVLEFPLSVSYATVNWGVIIVLISAIPLLIAVGVVPEAGHPRRPVETQNINRTRKG